MYMQMMLVSPPQLVRWGARFLMWGESVCPSGLQDGRGPWELCPWQSCIPLFWGLWCLL